MEESYAREYCRFNKSEYRPGIIIRAPLHEEDVMRRTPNSPSVANSYASNSRSHVSFSDFGTVYSESRFFIVVELYATHYLAVPLFTYSGSGLRQEHDAQEYASIVDHRSPGKSLKQAAHILTTGQLKHDVDVMKPHSVAHLTYPTSRKYNLHVAHQGELSDESTKNLVSLFRNRGQVESS